MDLYLLAKGITSTVKASLEESLVQILSPRRRIDILRDVMDAKKRGKPYSITFCGVNGVGKSNRIEQVFRFKKLSLVLRKEPEFIIHRRK